MSHRRRYECLICGRNAPAPLDGRPCERCGSWFCFACLPDHQAVCSRFTDAQAIYQKCRAAGTLLPPAKDTDTCASCQDGMERALLDEDGVNVYLTGRPGDWCHAHDDVWWTCFSPPLPGPSVQSVHLWTIRG